MVEELEHIIKSKSLRFVEKEAEIAYIRERNIKSHNSFKYFNIISTCFLTAAGLSILIPFLMNNYKTESPKMKEGCEIGSAIWGLYAIPPIILIIQIEHILMKCKFMRLRGLFILFAAYVLVSEAAIYEFADLESSYLILSFSYGFGTPVFVFIISQDIARDWISAAIVNLSGLLYFLIRHLFEGRGQYTAILYIIFISILMAHKIYKHERSARIQFFLYYETKKREEEWKELFDKLPLGLLIWSKKEDINYINTMLSNLLSEMTVPQNINSTILSHLIQTINIKWKNRGNKDRILHELHNEQDEGKKYLEVQKMKTKFNFKESSIYIISDQSVMKEVELKVIEAAKGKEIFFASMSHELRNPLNALLASVELLKNSSSEYDQEIIETASFCGEILLNLIGNILDVSKIESNKLEILPEPANFHLIMNKIASMLRTNAETKGLDLRLYGVNNKLIPTHFLYDQSRLNQVLINLIANSIKFTAQGGVHVKVNWYPVPNTLEDYQLFGPEDPYFQEIFMDDTAAENIANYSFVTWDSKISEEFLVNPTISGEEHKLSIRGENPIKENSIQLEIAPVQDKAEKGYMKIEIIDSGIGIAESDIQKLFKPFSQAKDSSKYFGGTGLGLWISNNIIQLMKGRIRIVSQLGKGSNFIILLPMNAYQGYVEKGELSTNIISATHHTQITQNKILLMDEDDNNRGISIEIFERNGFNITSCNSTAAAFDLFRDSIFDAIIVALTTPRDIFYFISNIRQDENKIQIPPRPIFVVCKNNQEMENIHQSWDTEYISGYHFLLSPLNVNAFADIFVARKPDIVCSNHSNEIIVVDDEPFSCLIAVRQLKVNGLEAASANNAQTCYTLFNEMSSTTERLVIIMDSHLPDDIGPNIAQTIIKTHQERNLSMKLIIISLSGDEIEKQHELYAGIYIHSFFQKPVNFAILSKMIKDIFDQ